MKIYRFNGKYNCTGPKIRAAREARKLTQEQLAAKLQTEGVGVNQKAISRMEAGERVVADYELIALSVSLGKKVTWLLGME